MIALCVRGSAVIKGKWAFKFDELEGGFMKITNAYIKRELCHIREEKNLIITSRSL